jgi:acyl carrier protein
VSVPTEAGVRSFVVSAITTELSNAGIDPATLNEQSDLFAAGIIDSLGVIELIAVVSDEYGIDSDWDDYDPEELLVLGPFCRYVVEKATAPPSAT